MKTEEYKKGLEKIVEIGKAKKRCIICAEREWFRCHHRFIADDLVRRGIKVVNLFDKDKVEEYKYKKWIERKIWCDKKAKNISGFTGKKVELYYKYRNLNKQNKTYRYISKLFI